MNRYSIYKFGWVLFLSLIISDLYAQKIPPEFWTNLNLIEGRKYNSNNYPEATITYRHIYHGSPVTKWDEFFMDKISILENNHPCSIMNHQPLNEIPTITINFLLDLHNIEIESLNKLQRILGGLRVKPEVRFYKFDSDSVKRLNFPDLYHNLSSNEQQFPENTI